MISVEGTPGFSRYLDAKINAATIEAIEALNNKLYLAKKSLSTALPPRNQLEEGVVWFSNPHLFALATKCRIVPSLAIIIQYERNLKDNSRLEGRGYGRRV